MRVRKFLAIMTLLMAMVQFGPSKYHSTRAATPMPTVIDMTNATDAEVAAYYAGVEGKSGDQLVSFLYSVIKDHNEYDYDNSTHRYIYKIIDRNWELDALDTVSPANVENFNYSADNGFIRKLYADYNDDITTADRFRNVGASRVSFDKEHVWAQSLGNFGRSGGAGSDFHSLLPSDVRGNQNAHSNYSFGVPETGITHYLSDKDTPVGRNGYVDGSPNKVFEPLDEYKGDVARAMFYMPARYYEYIDALHPKLELVNTSLNAHTATTTITGKAGILDTLLAWHELDPVDDYEIRRNNLIANNYQLNRNPFIDYPQWARIAYDPTYTGTGASNAPNQSSVGSNEDALLTHITLDTTHVKKDYVVNESFDTQGLVVYAHYNNERVERIFDYTVSMEDDTKLTTFGEQVITVTYTENEVTKTASYSINVSQPATSEDEEPTPPMGVDNQTIILLGVGAAIIFIIFILIFLSLNKKNRKKVVKKIKKTIKSKSKSKR